MSEQIKSGSNDLHTGQTIRTYQGHYINVFDPDPDTIDINDIAHALSQTCRFGGHTYKPYSVAQHSIDVAEMVTEPVLKLTALLHDATEAYICDIPRPIKRHLQGYKELEDSLMKAIAKKFKLIYPFPPDIKKADNKMLDLEHNSIILRRDYYIMSPKAAKRYFLEHFKKYTDKGFPYETDAEQWNDYYIKLKEHEEHCRLKKPDSADYGSTKEFENAMIEWHRKLFMDAPNRPGYIRANND